MGFSNSKVEVKKNKDSKIADNISKENYESNVDNISKQNNDNEINDKKEKGIIKYENGDYYEGEKQNGKRQGKGIEYYENGEIKYDGDWNNDLQDGNGKFVEKEGNYYIGELKMV